MFILFLTERNPANRLSRRRGGGKSSGKGEEGGGESSGSSSSSGTSSGSSTSKSSSVSTGKGSKSAVSYGSGGGKSVIIPSGQLFAGRPEGSGTRAQVFGTQTYGSGYPTNSGRGVAGRGFPFYFWPLSFGVAVGGSNAAYLNSSPEYGHADNSSRPGGVMISASFQSNGANGTVFRILADNTTTTDLIDAILANCSASLTNASISAAGSPTPYNDSSTSSLPQPEQIVQYYRASSIALSVDGYNDTSIFQAEGTPDVPIPSTIDATTLDCLNQTIGLAAPLIGGVGSQWAAIPNNMGLLGLVWLVWFSMLM